jgi:hypothetical protein
MTNTKKHQETPRNTKKHQQTPTNTNKHQQTPTNTNNHQQKWCIPIIVRRFHTSDIYAAAYRRGPTMPGEEVSGCTEG